MFRFKLLGVLLCYNDADILEDAILHLLEHNHDLVVWDHGSDDGTAEVLDKYEKHFRERKYVPRSFDFYNLYPEMSRNLIKNYVKKYDWISWPDQDELLEGPDRTKKYDKWLKEIHKQGHDFIQFNNYNYWFTTADNALEPSPAERVRHYSLFPDCAPRIRAWRASKTNIRARKLQPPSLPHAQRSPDDTPHPKRQGRPPKGRKQLPLQQYGRRNVKAYHLS